MTQYARLAKTAERGYGRPHQKRRAELQRAVDAGAAFCVECGGLIEPGTKRWHLAHDHRLGGYLGHAHVRCNIRERNRRHARVRRVKSREW